MGCDLVIDREAGCLRAFQSTHPVWDATRADEALRAIVNFNPRIPYGMRPGWLTLSMLLLLNFNPRIPYGMRRLRYCDAIALWEFQSTHPVWDATSAGKAILSGLLFQSTHPVWDATTIQTEGMTNARISIHASRMGCDRMLIRKITQQGISIHASRMGCDVTGRLFLLTNYYFNPRIPYGMRRRLC